MRDTPDFSAWYREQHPLVLAALTVASGRADVAADATDEAFVRAYERWDRVRRMASPGGWLYRVALNDLRRRCRRQAIERELLRRQELPPAPPPTVEPHLWEAVRRLPERQRTAVALRYVLDLPEADVARVMGVTRGSASATLTTARRRLESLLAPPPAPAPPPATPTRVARASGAAAGPVRPPADGARAGRHHATGATAPVPPVEPSPQARRHAHLGTVAARRG
jgi:RNA polymerase sigma factor (sigma-70 family)